MERIYIFFTEYNSSFTVKVRTPEHIAQTRLLSEAFNALMYMAWWLFLRKSTLPELQDLEILRLSTGIKG
jgi:hypothetical protein